VVTTSRADYGIYQPLLTAIANDPELRLRLIVSGMHLSAEAGLTVREIEADGYEIAERVEVLLASDTPEGISKSMGLAVIGFAQVFSRWRPDILVVLGDRFEMHAAALAALPFKIPVAHLGGGEVTEGAIDDCLRHSITKLSHIHFAATEPYGRRILQLGEEAWRLVVSGGTGLDELRTMEYLTREQLEERFQLQLSKPFLLVTYHPVTLEYEQAEWQIDELLAALRAADLPVIFTQSNVDTGNRVVRQKIDDFVASSYAKLVPSFGKKAYLSMLKLATAMVGNSSSGVGEAASFEIPVVNIGTRQRGRLRTRNVIDVDYGRNEILAAIRKAIDPEFRLSLRGLKNPYESGQACSIILRHLKTVPLGDVLIRKKFSDLPQQQEISVENK